MPADKTSETGASPMLEVIVVTYRCRDLAARCLESLERHGLCTAEMAIHVVDNDSRDGTVEMVRADHSGVHLDPLNENAGFSRANNIALTRTTAQYVLLLNPDTEVREGTLDHMLAVMDTHPDVGMAGCRLVRPDGSFDHAAKRSFPTPLAALAHFTGVGRGRSAGAQLAQYRAPDVDEYGVGDVDAVNGAFMLVRREALEQVGSLDEGYWLYMEDLDWCRRFHQGGWRVLYDGRVETLHVKGGASGEHRRLRQNVAFHRGMGRFYRRHEAGENPLLDLLVYCGIGVKLAVSLIRNTARSWVSRSA